MKYSLFVTEAAEMDIKEAFMWYKDQEHQLGDQFKNRIVECIESIDNNPYKFQIRYLRIRIAFLDVFSLRHSFYGRKKYNIDSRCVSHKSITVKMG